MLGLRGSAIAGAQTVLACVSMTFFHIHSGLSRLCYSETAQNAPILSLRPCHEGRGDESSAVTSGGASPHICSDFGATMSSASRGLGKQSIVLFECINFCSQGTMSSSMILVMPSVCSIQSHHLDRLRVIQTTTDQSETQHKVEGNT